MSFLKFLQSKSAAEEAFKALRKEFERAGPENFALSWTEQEENRIVARSFAMPKAVPETPQVLTPR